MRKRVRSIQRANLLSRVFAYLTLVSLGAFLVVMILTLEDVSGLVPIIISSSILAVSLVLLFSFSQKAKIMKKKMIGLTIDATKEQVFQKGEVRQIEAETKDYYKTTEGVIAKTFVKAVNEELKEAILLDWLAVTLDEKLVIRHLLENQIFVVENENKELGLVAIQIFE